jgi:hypothetical protein
MTNAKIGVSRYFEENITWNLSRCGKKNVLLDCLGLTIRLRVWDTHHGESEMVLVWSILDKLFDIPDVRNVMIDPRFCGFVVLGCLYWYVHRVEHEDDTQFVDMTKLLQQ